MLLIISNFWLWDELLRLIPVTFLSIFTPTIFWNKGKKTPRLHVLEAKNISDSSLLTQCNHICPPTHHKDSSFFFNLSWTPWKHQVVWGCFTPCLATATITAIYYLWDQSSKLIALKHCHRGHQEPQKVTSWILWPNGRRKKKKKIKKIQKVKPFAPRVLIIVTFLSSF